MLVLFIALLLLVLVIAAFSGNNDRRRNSYRHRRRYDDYDPYNPYYPYPPQSLPPYIEPGWRGAPWGPGSGGDKSAYGFVALVTLGLLAYYVFANNGPGLNKDGPPRETYSSQLNSSDLSSTNKPATKSVFPPEHTLKYNATGQTSSQPEVYTVDIPGEPAEELPDTYDSSAGEELLQGDFYIQAGSFSQLSGAKLEQDRLVELLGRPVRIHVEQSDGLTAFKLLVGPFLDSETASLYKKAHLGKETFVKAFTDYTPTFDD